MEGKGLPYRRCVLPIDLLAPPYCASAFFWRCYRVVTAFVPVVFDVTLRALPLCRQQALLICSFGMFRVLAYQRAMTFSFDLPLPPW